MWGWLLRRDLRGHASVSEALKANQASRTRFHREESDRAHPWEYVTKQTQPGGAWVRRMEAEGWEIASTSPVLIAGSTIHQQIITMRRPNPNFNPEEIAS